MTNIIEQLGLDIYEIREDVTHRAAKKVAESVLRKVKSDVVNQAQSIVNAKIDEVVEEVMMQTFQPVTNWGEAKGEPTTIRDMFAKTITDWWGKKVSPTSGKPDNYSSAISRAEYFAGKTVETDGHSFYPLLNGSAYEPRNTAFVHYDPRWGKNVNSWRHFSQCERSKKDRASKKP